MPVYSVVVSVDGKKKKFKTMQPASGDAEQEADRQFPGCVVISVGREGEDALRSSSSRNGNRVAHE